jgi:hypothetical protein
MADAGLLVLFPGYVLYHYAVAVGWIPASAGGMFGGASAVLAAFGLCHLGWRAGAGRLRPTAVGVAFAVLCLLVVARSVGAFLVLPPAEWVSRALAKALSAVVIWIAAFYLGAVQEERAGRMPWVWWLALLTIFVLLLHAMVVHRTFTGPYQTFSMFHARELQSSGYQGIGRSVMVTALMVVAGTSAEWRRWTVLGLTAVALLSVGSRAHFFGIIAVATIFAALLSLRRGSRGAAAGLVLTLAIVGFASVDAFQGTRASQVLDLSQSSSWQARLEGSRTALDTIADHPILGSFGYSVRDDDIVYAHNALSAWAEWGFPAFLLYAGLIVTCFAMACRSVLRHGTGRALWLTSFVLNTAAVFLAVATESAYASVIPALGWGITVAAVRNDCAEAGTRKMSQDWGRRPTKPRMTIAGAT